MTRPILPDQDDPHAAKPYPNPLKVSGALDKFKYVECSPALGREYDGLQLSSIIDDEVIVRDLAITSMSAQTISESLTNHSRFISL
jgi:hypothetical protein